MSAPPLHTPIVDPNKPGYVSREWYQYFVRLQQVGTPTAGVMVTELRITMLGGGAAGPHTVTGIAPGDRLIAVTRFSAGTVSDITSEFTITAVDTLDNTGGTDTTGDTLQVQWVDV